MLTHHVFVGIVDLNRGLSLMQHSTRLYLVNHIALAFVQTLLPHTQTLMLPLEKSFSTS